MNQSISDFNNILQRHIILSVPVKKKKEKKAITHIKHLKLL